MNGGRIVAAVALLLAAGGVAACSGSSASSGSSLQSPSRLPRSEAPNSGLSGTASASTQGRNTAVRLAPQLILTGTVRVTVDSVNTAADRAESMAAAVGGRTDSDDRGEVRGSDPVARLVLRVPNAAVAKVMTGLAALGRVGDRQLSTRDVTTEVADVDSRVTSAKAAIDALRLLYRRSADVADVIRIGTALSQREASLELLQAEQRTLATQVDLATITVVLTGRAVTKPLKHATGSGGFTGGLDSGWRAFTSTAAALATAFGAVLPFLATLALLGGIGGLWWHRRRPRPSPTGSPD